MPNNKFKQNILCDLSKIIQNVNNIEDTIKKQFIDYCSCQGCLYESQDINFYSKCFHCKRYYGDKYIKKQEIKNE